MERPAWRSVAKNFVDVYYLEGHIAINWCWLKVLDTQLPEELQVPLASARCYWNLIPRSQQVIVNAAPRNKAGIYELSDAGYTDCYLVYLVCMRAITLDGQSSLARRHKQAVCVEYITSNYELESASYPMAVELSMQEVDFDVLFLMHPSLQPTRREIVPVVHREYRLLIPRRRLVACYRYGD